MKAAMLLPVWDDPTLPGLARDLAEGLRGKVEFVAFARARRRGQPRRGREGALEVRLVGWTAPPALCFIEGIVNAALVPFALAREVRREAPDLVHYQFSGNDAWLFVGLAAPWLGAPLRATLQGPLRGFPGLPLQRWLCSRVLRRAVAVSAVSEETRRSVAAFLPSAASKTTTIGNGIDAAFFAGAAGARPQARAYVLTLSRGSLAKGLDVLLLAFHDVCRARPGVDLLVCGPQEEGEPMRRFAARLGIERRVKWLGCVPKAEVAVLLKHCELMALGSRGEGSSLAVLEALAAGAPIVATAVGGAVECLADGENALLVPTKDPTALAAAMSRVLDDPGLRARLSSGARGCAGSHDRARMCEAYLRWYRGVPSGAAPEFSHAA